MLRRHPSVSLLTPRNLIVFLESKILHKFCNQAPNKRDFSVIYRKNEGAQVRIAVKIQKGQDIRQGVISLSDETNAKYVLQRFIDLGWKVVNATRLVG